MQPALASTRHAKQQRHAHRPVNRTDDDTGVTRLRKAHNYEPATRFDDHYGTPSSITRPDGSDCLTRIEHGLRHRVKMMISVTTTMPSDYSPSRPTWSALSRLVLALAVSRVQPTRIWPWLLLRLSISGRLVIAGKAFPQVGIARERQVLFLAALSHPGFDGDFDASVRLAKGEVSADVQSEEVPRGAA
jgi:hypothetical protein